MSVVQLLFTQASGVKGQATAQGNGLILQGSPVSDGDARRGQKDFDPSDLDSLHSILGLPASGSSIVWVDKAILVSISLGRMLGI